MIWRTCCCRYSSAISTEYTKDDRRCKSIMNSFMTNKEEEKDEQRPIGACN